MVEFKNVYISYKTKSVLTNVNLTIQDGEFFVLIGSSGCGKTTLLKSINQIISIEKGELSINGRAVNQVKTDELPGLVGYVVQSGGLFPHMTIEENVALTLKITHTSKDEIQTRVDQMLKMVNLDPELYRNQYPSQLSGGQQQRVGVARAFAADPSIVLMDEPFSALDPVTRTELQNEILGLQKKTGKTVIFVTHDMDEAIKLADRICIIQNGRIVQCDIPENILKHPANHYVASFVGENRLWANPGYIRAADIMRKHPLTVSSGRTVLQALQIMHKAGVDSLLMIDDKHILKGILWLKTLMEQSVTNRIVDELICTDIKTIHEETTLKEIIADLDFDKISIIPVVSENNRLVGFLTKSSLLSVMSRQFVSAANPEKMENNV